MDSINDLFSVLTPNDIEALKETADAFLGNNCSDSNSQNSRQSKTNNGFDFGKIDPEMFSKIGRIISAMNSDGDKKYRLIEALKPNLSPQRQHKADEAIQILKLFEVLPLIKEFTDTGKD